MAGTLLLADDSITIQKVVELTFAGTDLNVVAVSSGRELLQRLPELNPDIVLCDVVMPEMDGYDICQSLKSDPNTLHIPVVLLTGTFEPFDRDRALAAGCDAIVTKPFEAKELVRVVEDLLQPGGQAGPFAMDATGIPEGVPSLDFTTTGFERMVPPPAEAPAVPEHGLEVTSLGSAGQPEGPSAAASDQTEADLPWGEEVPEAAMEIPEEETFPSPVRSRAEDDAGEEGGPGLEPLETPAPADAIPAAPPWDAEGQAPMPSPWDTAPPDADWGGAWASGDAPMAEGTAGDDAIPSLEGPEGESSSSGAGAEESWSPPPLQALAGEDAPSAPEEAVGESEVFAGSGEIAPEVPELPLRDEPGSLALGGSSLEGELPVPPEGTAPGIETLPQMEEEAGAAMASPGFEEVSPTPDQIPVEDTSPAADGGSAEVDLEESEIPLAVEPDRATAVAAGEAVLPAARELTDEDIDRIARRVLELAQPMLERIAWEVIPDMAEMLVHRRIQELEAAAEQEV